MSQEIEDSEQMLTAVELLADLASTFQTIATNLHKNRLDRKPLQRLFHDYAARAESDGRLINASRQHPHCVSRGLFLAYTHMELLSWTANHNYTIMSTSVKWYSWRKVFARYRLPLFSVSTDTAELQSLMKNIERVAGMVASELEDNNVSIPATSIKYLKVPPDKLMGPPPETIHALIQRGILARQRLTRSCSAPHS